MPHGRFRSGIPCQGSFIVEESIRHETRKPTGELPTIGVNTFHNPHADHVT